MAAPSEIITLRDRQRLPVSDRIHNVVDTTGGLTDELYNTRIMQTLGNTAPAYLEKAEYSEEPNVPTLDAVLSKLGVKADNDPTGEKAARKFVEDFAKKQGIWKKKVERDPDLGKRGWGTVKDLFKKTANDLMESDIRKGRYDAMHDGSVLGGLVNIMFPRAVKAGEEGRDPEMNEWTRDIAANAAYAVPVGRAVGTAIKGAPSVVRAIAQPISQFVAPTAVAGMDAVVDDNYDSGDFATDAAVGGLTNLGVNRILGPAIGRALGTFASKVTARPPAWLRATLEGASTPREIADEKVAQATRTLKQADRPFSASELVNGTASSLSKDERASAQGIKEIAEATGKTLKVDDKRTLTPSEVLQGIESATKGKLKRSNQNDIVGSVVQQLNFPETAPTVQNPKISKEFREGAKRYSKILEANPELKTLFAPEERISVRNVASPLETYAVNQWGSSRNAPASAAGSAFGLDVKKMRDDNAGRKSKEQARAAISGVLAENPDLTDEDVKYLKAVEANPDLLRFSQDDGLKQWLLRRGHGILSGTAAHRPTWEVR